VAGIVVTDISHISSFIAKHDRSSGKVTVFERDSFIKNGSGYIALS